MKKLAFIHDHEFVINGKDAYSPGKLSTSSFDRYLSIFDHVTIVSRYRLKANGDTLATLNKVTDSRIDFQRFENQSKFINRFVLRSKYKKKLREILKHFDALVIRVPSEIGFLASEIALELKIPYVCEVVACPSDAMDGFNSIKSRLYKKIIVQSMKKTVLFSSGALYVTRYFLQERYPTKGFTCIASNVEINELGRCREYSQKSVYRIVLTGNLDSFHKGYDILFLALEELTKKLSFNIELHLVGKGSIFKRAINYTNINIHYPGVLGRTDLFDLLDSSDLYIQPSNQEGLPRATIEAMSRGLPCVVSDAGGLPELVDPKFVHPKNSPNELANKILNILTSKGDFELASINNIEVAKQFLTKDLRARRLDFYQKLRDLC
ncbi:glycosyltransferase [Pseudoalteromonas shioyasakiensis]|uniref:glycosyltransferase n=1 Tax=Pseudoalteromonas shioyasakiensis TaxID=1190813 RepID=UPI002551E2C0|nr:glycosyltransferase [Pseudoalteromonas shioyasakiensis]MDK9684920.1 glycosyltransferase [Pseudoalteromonas shioyasakiensis]